MSFFPCFLISTGGMLSTLVSYPSASGWQQRRGPCSPLLCHLVKCVEKSMIKWLTLALIMRREGPSSHSLCRGILHKEKAPMAPFASFEPCNIFGHEQRMGLAQASTKRMERSSARTCLVSAPTEMKSIPVAAYPARVSRVTLPETSSLALP